MIVTNGSTVVKEEASMNMFSVKFDMNITGDVIFFAKDEQLVKEYIDIKLRNIKMPLPFGGQDGSIHVKVNSIDVKEV